MFLFTVVYAVVISHGKDYSYFEGAMQIILPGPGLQETNKWKTHPHAQRRINLTIWIEMIYCDVLFEIVKPTFRLQWLTLKVLFAQVH